MADLSRTGTSQAQRDDALKWIQFYLDFCRKYAHPPRESESRQPFLHKLAAKRQSVAQQEAASKALDRFYHLIPGFGGPGQTVGSDGAPDPWAVVLQQLKEIIQLRQYAPATLKTYSGWVRAFRAFLDAKDPDQVDADDAVRFLTDLAIRKKVVASTQNQAFNALLFLFRHVWERPYDLTDRVVRAKRRRYVPVVLSRAEVDTLFEHMTYPSRLMAQLMYGCGFRLAEGCNLRVQDFNFTAGIVTAHHAKGGKNRSVPLPKRIIPDLESHMERVRNLFEQDLENPDFDGAFMPRGAASKAAGRAKQWPWQFFFPAKTLTLVPEDGVYRRYHYHENQVGKTLRSAARKAKFHKRVTAHTLRHSFASHLLLSNVDIRTVQVLMGHSDVKTTMIYTQTVPSRTLKEGGSPYDLDAALIDEAMGTPSSVAVCPT